MQAKDFFTEVYRRGQIVEQTEERVDKLRSIAECSVSQIDPVKVQGSKGNRREDALIAFSDAQGELLEAVGVWMQHWNQASAALEALEDEEAEFVFFLRYFHRLDWAEIAKKTPGTKAECIEIHRRALDALGGIQFSGIT